MTRDIGMTLSDNVRRIYVQRQGRKVFVGTLDLDQRLYQWAPAKNRGIKGMVYQGSIAFGMDEWNQIKDTADRFELKDGTTNTIYRNKIERVLAGGRVATTPNGPRFLVPIKTFLVIKDGEVVRLGQMLRDEPTP